MTNTRSQNPETVPAEIQSLAQRVSRGQAPESRLNASIVAHVDKTSSRIERKSHAAWFVDAMQQTPGAPKVRIWSKDSIVRVYFPGEAGYVTFDAGGRLSEMERGYATFMVEALYPSQRRAYRKALAAYYAELPERLQEDTQERVLRIEKIRRALGLDRHDNPSTHGSFDMSIFDEFDATEEPAPRVSRPLDGVKRSDIVSVGRKRWVVMRRLGDSQVLAYRHPSKHRKLYEIILNRDNTASVFEIGGSGQRISDSLVDGPISVTGETHDLDNTAKIKRRVLKM